MKVEDLDLAIRDAALVRVERMDNGLIWMEVTHSDGSTTTINFSTPRGATIRHRVEERPAPAVCRG